MLLLQVWVDLSGLEIMFNLVFEILLLQLTS